MSTDILTVEYISAEVLAEYPTWDYPVAEMLKRIMSAELVSYEGRVFRVLDRDIQDGDHYFTGRNVSSGINGVRLMQAKEVDRQNGWILPVDPGYPFDIWECIPVEPVK